MPVTTFCIVHCYCRLPLLLTKTLLGPLYDIDAMVKNKAASPLAAIAEIIM